MESKSLRVEVVSIVRNEMEFIARMIESVKDSDSIHIIDTGSNDNGETCRIARSFGEKVKVYENEYRWEDSFCKARNYAKSKATPGCWIVSLDADEVIHDFGSVRRAVEFAESKGIRAIDILQHAEDGSKQTNVFPRLFRNDPDIIWHGAAHNYLSLIGTLLVEEDGVIREATSHSEEEKNKALVHLTFGYSLAHLEDKDRTLRILEKAVNTPDSGAGAREKFYLGREYYYRGRWEEANKMLGKYVQESGFLAEKAEAFIMMSTAYWNRGLGEDARDACLQALKINPNFKEACVIMASMVWPKHASQWLNMARTADNSDVLFRREVIVPENPVLNEPPAVST